MKISGMMQKGWERIGRKQNFGAYFSDDGKSACALGCLYLGIKTENKPSGKFIGSFLYENIPRLGGKKIKCLPKIHLQTTLGAQIFINNDNKKMSIPKIIKALKKCGL